MLSHPLLARAPLVFPVHGKTLADFSRIASPGKTSEVVEISAVVPERNGSYEPWSGKCPHR